MNKLQYFVCFILFLLSQSTYCQKKSLDTLQSQEACKIHCDKLCVVGRVEFHVENRNLWVLFSQKFVCMWVGV